MHIEHLTKRADGLSGKPLNLDREKLELWIMFKPESLKEALEFFAPGGAKEHMPASVRMRAFSRFNGYSGYEYRIEGDCRAEVGFTPLQYGGFAFHKIFSDSNGSKEVWEIFSSEGKLLSVDTALHLSIQYLDTAEMDTQCVILSHLYNYLSYEYEQAKFGLSKPKQIEIIESFLRKIKLTAPHKDPAVLAVWDRIKTADLDAVLNWDERQKIIESLFQEREKIIITKLRAHAASSGLSRLFLMLGDLKNRFERLRARPGSNIRGFLYKYTIGVLIWFFQTVRGNIGYSMALAIYGPFTFYFITQPLNPHAMWAVGRVRSVYLDTTEKMQSVANLVSGGAAAVTAATSDVIAPTQKETLPQTPSSAPMPKEDPNLHLGIPLSTDFKDIDGLSWSDRMSNFKNMQIGYEENMQFSARMGRLEQMETQLNFHLIADNAWQETERYLAQIAAIKANNKPTAELLTYFETEERSTQRLQMYIWDRLLRYILDHPYVVMDQSKEQVYHDYYLGRAFLLFRDITLKLQRQHADFKRPADFKKLDAIATSFQKTRVEADTILGRIKANSQLFNQKDRFDGHELRGYMKRQWEILYLLQNKAQEASNFGLMSYTWSVRNTLWLLQSLHSTKRRELNLIFGTDASNKDAIVKEIRTSVEPMYEEIFHMMNLEYVSLKPELSERLANDIEFRQRKVVIDTIENWITSRESTLKGLLK